VNREENIDGVICCAAPIWDSASIYPVAALSVSGPSIRMELILDAVKQEVKRVASRISAMLGGSSDASAQAAAVSSGHSPILS
jgi:DNA-binding IclR family transcriptional regulator